MPFGTLAALSYAAALLSPVPLLQQGFLVLGLLLLNFALHRGLGFSSDRILLLGLGFTASAVLLAYLVYLNALSLGHPMGVVKGNYGRSVYFDANAYLVESRTLSGILFGPDFPLWLSGRYPWFGFYGPYNAYNVFNALLIRAMGEHVLPLVLAKAFFPVSSIYLLQRVSDRILEREGSVFPAALYAFNPANLLVAASLLRDDIISFFCILTVLLFLRFRETPSSFGRVVRGIQIGVALCGLFLVRDYAAAVFTLALVLLAILRERLRLRRVLFYSLLLAALALLAIQFVTWDRVAQYLFEYEGKELYDVERTRGLRLPAFVGYYYLLGQTKWLELYDFRALPELFGFAGYLFLNMVLLLSAFCLAALLYKGRLDRWGRRMFAVLGILVPLLLLALLTFIFGSPVHRHYGMWIWLNGLAIALYLRSAPVYRGAAVVAGSFAVVSLVYWAKYLISGGGRT